MLEAPLFKRYYVGKKRVISTHSTVSVVRRPISEGIVPDSALEANTLRTLSLFEE